jgi:hypothetical protein
VESEGSWLVEWHVWTSGPRAVAPEAAIDVLLDFDQDGRFDRALTTVHGPDWRRGYAVGEWLVLNTPLIPGTLKPDISRALSDPIPLAWDLDERVTTLTARAEELLIDLPSGQERFGYAVRLRDAFGDFPTNSVFPGYDDSPDGLAGGDQYTFVQDDLACVEVREANGARIDRAGTSLSVAATSSLRLDAAISADCESSGDVMLMVSFPANVRDTPAAHIWPVHLEAAEGLCSLWIPSTLAG